MFSAATPVDFKHSAARRAYAQQRYGTGPKIKTTLTKNQAAGDVYEPEIIRSTPVIDPAIEEARVARENDRRLKEEADKEYMRLKIAAEKEALRQKMLQEEYEREDLLEARRQAREDAKEAARQAREDAKMEKTKKNEEEAAKKEHERKTEGLMPKNQASQVIDSVGGFLESSGKAAESIGNAVSQGRKDTLMIEQTEGTTERKKKANKRGISKDKWKDINDEYKTLASRRWFEYGSFQPEAADYANVGLTKDDVWALERNDWSNPKVRNANRTALRDKMRLSNMNLYAFIAGENGLSVRKVLLKARYSLPQVEEYMKDHPEVGDEELDEDQEGSGVSRGNVKLIMQKK